MKKLFAACFFILNLFIANQAFALLSLELTRGVAGAVPIAVVPFAGASQNTSQDISSVIGNDLQNSGRFKLANVNSIGMPSSASEAHFDELKRIGADNAVVGKVEALGSGRYQVSFQLLDVFKGTSTPQSAVLLNQKFTVTEGQLRPLAHHISDMVYQQITGVRGIFSTRLAYIVVQRSPSGASRYTLEVSDQDGFNPKPLLTSSDPIMSPSWSPNGKQVAYVSFEKKHASIYVQDVATAARRLITDYPGINGAPAWSPDGRKLALVLSKSGSPNIYTCDLNGGQLTQLTNDLYINTEPSWSPDGRSIIFTSNRSGNPQIYQLNLATRAVTRVTYDGKYNARGSFTPDGNHIVVLNQDSGLFNIGVLDLDGGTFRVLTSNSGSDHESPSMAPNGSMVLFGSIYNGRSVLGMAATDGSVQVRLPARDGEVQDPAWSPFLS
jgi:TolB protein